jgi:hypothetical protein
MAKREDRQDSSAGGGAQGLTDEEHEAQLRSTLADSLAWWSDLASKRQAKGISAAYDSYSKAAHALASLEGKTSVGSIDLSVPGFDMALLRFNKESKPELESE